MEIISLSGYTEEEKIHIAKIYLVPRQREEHGLKPEQIAIDDAALRRVIGEYTREAGVRSLERQIGTLARKVAARVATDAPYVGPHHRARHARLSRPVALPIGRRIPPLARRASPRGSPGRKSAATSSTSRPLLPGGRGHLTLTGQLGSVMQESARAALSHVRRQASRSASRRKR